jgi:predicted nucleic acid-binding protein
MIVVSDTSAITALLQIGRSELLKELYREVLIPNAVRQELVQAHPQLPVFLRCEQVLDNAKVQRLLIELDLGEAEAIVLAKERRANVLLMDEIEGRRVALREGVPFIGLLGVVVQAKQMGHIHSVRQLTQELEAIANFHLSPEIKAVAFQKAGEM